MKMRFVENARVLVTGGAGFIGSNLVDSLLAHDNDVVVLDNFATGRIENLAGCLKNPHFHLIFGDIRDMEKCRQAVDGVDFVLHEAALGSVPRSIKNPMATVEVNICGFVNMLFAAQQVKVKRFIYATSSSVYGDSKTLPKVEDSIGRPLNPYAITKHVDELFADNFARLYGAKTIGLRYFNVFGRRQDPAGAYAAAIPKFAAALLKHESPVIHGDGSFSRDFTYIDNVIQANMRALTVEDPEAFNQVYNIAFGVQTTLNDLFSQLRATLAVFDPRVASVKAVYDPVRTGDIPHSLACIDKARKVLGYKPEFNVQQGLERAAQWYFENLV